MSKNDICVSLGNPGCFTNKNAFCTWVNKKNDLAYWQDSLASLVSQSEWKLDIQLALPHSIHV